MLPHGQISRSEDVLSVSAGHTGLQRLLQENKNKSRRNKTKQVRICGKCENRIAYMSGEVPGFLAPFLWNILYALEGAVL